MPSTVAIPKFNVSQYVWTLYENNIMEVMIVGIVSTQSILGSTPEKITPTIQHIWYTVTSISNPGLTFPRDEKELFRTKKELQPEVL